MSAADARAREKPLVISGLMSVAGLATALIYAFHSTPYTMVLFMSVGLTLFGGAVLVFVMTIVRDLRGRLNSLKSSDFTAGEVICKQGDPADFMYVISEGEVEFVVEEEGRGEIQIGKLGPSDYFGDMAILSDTPYQATALAVGDVKLLAIHRDDFQSMYTHLPNLRERVAREQERQLAMVERKLGRKLS